MDALYDLKEKLEKSYNKKSKFSFLSNKSIYHDTNIKE